MSKTKISISFLIILTLISVIGCGENTEPDTEDVGKSYLNDKETFYNIISNFRNDVTAYNINIVRAEIPDWANCNSFPCELPSVKWNKYRNQLKKIGCSWVKYETNPERIYFIIHYESFLMDARIKGLIYTEEKHHSISAYQPKQEWEKIDNNWYVFTMIDN